MSVSVFAKEAGVSSKEIYSRLENSEDSIQKYVITKKMIT